MMNKIKRFCEYIKESIDVDQQIKDYVLDNYYSEDILVDCLRMKYGEVVPLFHATDEGSVEMINKEGLRPVEWSNNRTTSDQCVYFQIGKSDYVASNRPVLYKWDCPLEYFARYAYIDSDSVYTLDEDLEEMGFDIDGISSDSREFLSYFVANDYKLEGMEIFFANRDDDPYFPKMMAKRIN